MAKRTIQGIRGRNTSARSTGRSSSLRSTGKNISSKTSATKNSLSKKFDFKNFNKADVKRAMKKVSKNPIALYLAGGVGALILGRFAYKYYRNHPEIKEFIRENFDTVESSLREYRSGSVEETAEARH